VFAGDDDAAVGVIRALKDQGYRVPEDVAVVGFDDSRLSAYLNPPLTTIRAPTFEVGKIAARQLFFRLHNGAPESAGVERVTLLPTEIIFRRSCGCGYS
jgi:DNA-binding LacI/PurR family transcriptional regulator